MDGDLSLACVGEWFFFDLVVMFAREGVHGCEYTIGSFEMEGLERGEGGFLGLYGCRGDAVVLIGVG